nr:NUDIX domain-containing protein [Chloroflexota bacterium]
MARLKAASKIRLPVAVATSAGGIVIRTTPGGPEICLGKRRRERDGVTWTLPKGTPDAGETTEETALREVTEETGLAVRILEPVGSIEYWFIERGSRIHKTVHY